MHRRAFMAASAAAPAAPAVGRAQAARVLKFIPQSDLGSLDPVWTVYFPVRNHASLVFDTLYGQAGPEAGFEAAPQMAAGHTVEDDGRTWTLRLRDGLRFHDGEPVLARDCVASIRRWGARDSFGQTLMQRTDELSAPDDRRVVFRLRRPFPRLADALGKSNGNMCAVMPERLAATDPFKQVTEMVGSGPFRFKADERVPGSFVAYERFGATCHAAAACRTRPPGRRWPISTGWNGTSSPTRPPPPRRCSRARWTGGSSPRPTCCRRSAATARSP